MTEEINNNIDTLDGMVKIKGKCGYEIIGGCRELRELKQENERLKKSEDEWRHSAEYARILMIKFQSALEEIREIEQCMAVAKGVSENPVSAIDHMSNLLSEYENRRIKVLTRINEVLE